MILLNEHGKQAATTGQLRNVWSLGSYDPAEQYFIEVQSMEVIFTTPGAPNGKFQLPVQSVGRRENPVRYYFAADLRFLSQPGFECVLPAAPVELEMSVWPSGGGFKASLSHQGFVVFQTPQFMPTEADAVSGLARWAMAGDKSKWVMPDAVVQAVEAMRKKAAG